MSATCVKIEDARIPEGWWIERNDQMRAHINSDDLLNAEERLTFTRFEVYEEGGAMWEPKDPTEEPKPRSVIEVEVWWADEGEFATASERETRISWPSTSDKRPALAHAFSVALMLAYEAVQEVTP
jgi:hypothetical protein